MRIDKIEFKNFRKYVDTKMEFTEEDNDIHVIIADNGVGKTTFLNAMTWCLYNEEPKIKKKEESLPTLNTDISNSSVNDREEASVSLVITDNGDKFIYKRTDFYKIHSINSEYYKKYGRREEFINQEFTVTEIVDNISNVIRNEEECAKYVSDFIPESIKEFYFFDGEQLDNYFLTSNNIKNQVFELSNIYLLDSMERRLEDKIKNFRNKGSINEKSDDKLEELNNITKDIEENEDRLDKLKKAYKSKHEELNGLLSYLRDIPSLTKIEEKRESNESLKEKHMISIDNKKKELMDILIKDSPKILAKSAFKETLGLIEEKNNEGGNIYYIDEDILIDSIKGNRCKVCDRELDEELINHIQDKRTKLYLISPEDKLLKRYNKYFEDSLKVEDNFLKVEKKLLGDINTAEETIASLEEDIKEAYDTVKVHENYRDSLNKRDELVELLPERKSDIDRLEEHINHLKNKQKSIEKEYDKLCDKEKKNLDIISKRKLCQKSLEVIKKVKQDIMDETRNDVEESTKEIFFNLIRKYHAFSNIKITDNYEVKLFDEEGRHALSSASASEQEILALAFTLAIHSISGYESPLVVDTLLARTSGIQRKNVAQGCLDVSKKKQMLLFLLDDEYSEPVKELFKSNNVPEYNLIESESEKELDIVKV